MDRILVVAAHPDDEVLGCGGLLAALAKQKRSVSVMILTGPTTSRGSNQDLIDSYAESERAATTLGVPEYLTLGWPDNRLDSVPLLDIVKKIESRANEFRPDTVLVHDHTDLNIDHQIANRATLTAFRPEPGSSVNLILSYETLSSTEWQDSGQDCFRPNFFFNIENELPIKIAAFGEYLSEHRTYPHPRSCEGIKIQAQRRGIECGCVAAEAFRVIRCIPRL